MRFYSLLFLFSCVTFNVFGQQLKQVLPIGHTEGISTGVFSPDGRYLLTASEDKTVKLWEVPTGFMLAELRTTANWFRSIGFVPGNRFVFASENGQIVNIWNKADGKIHTRLSGKMPGYSNSFTPDGRKAITFTFDSVILWEVATGQQSFGMEYKNINTASFSNDGKLFVAAGNDGVINIYHTENGSLRQSFKASEKGIFDVAFSPDDQRVLASSGDLTASAWTVDGKMMYRIGPYKDAVPTAVHSSDGRYIFIIEPMTFGDSTLKIFDAASGSLTREIKSKLNNYNIQPAMYHPETDVLMIPDDKESDALRLLSLRSDRLDTTITGHSTYIRSAAISADGKYRLTTSYDKSARLYNHESRLLSILQGKTNGPITNIYLSGNKKYLCATNYRQPSFWNASDGTYVNSFNAGADEIMRAVFSNDGRYLVTMTKANEVRLWDATTETLINDNLKKDSEGYWVNYQGNFSFTADNKKIFIADHDKTAQLFDAATGKLLAEVDHGSGIGCAAISQDGKYIATNGNDTVKLWNAATGKVFQQVHNKDFTVDSIVFSRTGEHYVLCNWSGFRLFKTGAKQHFKGFSSSDGRYIGIISGRDMIIRRDEDDGLELIDITTGKTILTHSDDDIDMWSSSALPQFFLAGDLLLYRCSYSLKVLNIRTKKIVSELRTFNGSPYAAVFNSDKTKLLVGYHNGIIRYWDVGTGEMIREWQAHEQPVTAFAILPGEKKFVSVSADNTAKAWQFPGGTELYSFFPLGNKDYFLKEPSGYYMCSPDAARTLYYVTPDLKVITFDQLDTRYNRPDKLLTATGSTDTSLVQSYRKAFQKRAARLGIDTSFFGESFTVPQAEVLNRNLISYEQHQPILELRIHATDSTYNLNTFNVWVNEVPVFGTKGISIKHKGNRFDTTLSVRLSTGDNRVETSVTNVNGTESYRMPLIVQHVPTTPQEEKIHFIGIGINRFQQPGHDLNWSVKDIRDFAFKLKEKYPSVIIDTLFDESVTRKNILSLKQKLLSLGENDRVVISYSGHGLLSKDLDYFLSTYDINFNDPAVNGFAYDDLQSLVDNIRPRKKLVLIDACHSGEVDKDEIAKIESASGTLDSLGMKTKSTIKVSPKKKIGMHNSFELMQNLFVNVSRGTGATIISAAGGMQYAQERGDLKNGIFTYSILDAFNKHVSLTVSELKKIVSETVVKMTNGLQKPTSRNETNLYDWTLW